MFIDLGKSGGRRGRQPHVRRAPRRRASPPIDENDVGQDDRRFPARALGEIVIVEVGEKISVGLVTLSVQEMGVGDIVMMQKSR